MKKKNIGKSKSTRSVESKTISNNEEEGFKKTRMVITIISEMNIDRAITITILIGD
jgi:hypothetical protein